MLRPRNKAFGSARSAQPTSCAFSFFWGWNFAEMVIGERGLTVRNPFAVALLGLLSRCSYVAPSPQISSEPKPLENPLNCCCLKTFSTIPAIKKCLTADIFYCCDFFALIFFHTNFCRTDFYRTFSNFLYYLIHSSIHSVVCKRKGKAFSNNTSGTSSGM